MSKTASCADLNQFEFIEKKDATVDGVSATPADPRRQAAEYLRDLAGWLRSGQDPAAGRESPRGAYPDKSVRDSFMKGSSCPALDQGIDGGWEAVLRGEHPNSRANLRPPWRPGSSGNPNGRPAGSYRGIRHLFAEYKAKPIEEIETELRISAEVSAVKKSEQKKERVQCTVCRHKNLALIDGLLTLGIPVRAVAENYTLTRSAVERHKHNHLPTFPMAKKARSVMKAQKLLPPLIEKLKTVDEDDLVGSTWPIFDTLWKAFENTLDDSPKDWLLLYLAKACIWLYRIRGRDYDAYEANLEDVREAIQVLELWRDRKGHNSAVKQREKHRNTVDQVGQTGQRCRQGSEV